MKYPFPSVVDSSMMASVKSCFQLANLSYLEDWKPKELSVHLHAGGAFAKAIEVSREAFYCAEHDLGYIDEALDQEGNIVRTRKWKKIPCPLHDSDYAIGAGLNALLFSYGDFQCPPDSAKSAERMAGAFEFYFANYPLSQSDCSPIILPSGKHGIEFSFVHPLPVLHPETGDPLLYSGRLDAILNFAGGVFMFDEKTTSSLGATWSRQWDLRSQFTGYGWGCREAGIRVDGAVVRGVSILKTKYDTQEAITYRPEWQIDRWLSDTCDYLELLISMWKRGKFLHNLDHSCTEYGGCSFRQACLSQDTQPWLETYFERRHWDPITRKETLLLTK